MIKNFILNLIQNSKGTTAIEYALITALLALSTVGILSAIGSGLTTTFGTISTTLN